VTSAPAVVDLSVVIPVYDEGESLPVLWDELREVLTRLGVGFEVVFVDDGSEDGSGDIIRAFRDADPRVRLVRLKSNAGETAATDAGLRTARGRRIVTMDGDLQNDPADIPRLLAHTASFDVVCGWRKDRKDDFLTRYVPSVAANWLIGIVSGVRIHDIGCSLKVGRAECLKPLKLRPGTHRYLPPLARQLGARITEVVVNHRPRRFGRSKYGLSRTFTVIVDLFRLRRMMREAADPASDVAAPYEIARVLEQT